MTICNKAKEILDNNQGVCEEFNVHYEGCEICKQDIKPTGEVRADSLKKENYNRGRVNLWPIRGQ